MSFRLRTNNNTLSTFFIVKNFNTKLSDDKDIKFSIVYNNTLYIEYDMPRTIKNLTNKFPRDDIILLTPDTLNTKTLYFCHLPEGINTRNDFENLILLFLPNKTFKIKAYIAEKVFSIIFDTEEDATRIATFIPQIDFEVKSDNEEEEEEEDEEEEYIYPQHIFVGKSWFDMPIVRFSSVPIDIKPEKFKKLRILRDTEFCQFQKNKTSNKSKIFQSITVIAKSIDQAKKIIKMYNFGSFKNEMAYVNWFVDNETLEQLEKYKIKVFPQKDDPLSNANETDFFIKMTEYGRVFSVTLCRSSNEINNNNDEDDDSDFDMNEAEDGDEENEHDSNENKGKDDTVLFGNVIFINKDDIHKVEKDYQIEYWFSGGMMYNFPYNTSEEDVKNYLSKFSDKLQSVELRNEDQMTNDNKILPFFFVTFDSVDTLEDARQYVDNHPYQIKNMKGKMQPFIIPREKNLPSTIQKYNFHRDLLLKSNTIIVKNLTKECSALNLINLFADYGTIMFFKIDSKDEVTANITFSDESEMEAAIENVNDAIFNKVKLIVTSYSLPNDNSVSAGTKNSKKKKKNKNKAKNKVNETKTNESNVNNNSNANTNTNTNPNNNNKIIITKKDNRNNIGLVINRTNSNPNQRNNEPNQRNNNQNQKNYNQNQKNYNQNQRNNFNNQKNYNPNQRNNFNNQRAPNVSKPNVEIQKRDENEKKFIIERRGRSNQASRGRYSSNTFSQRSKNNFRENEYDKKYENEFENELTDDVDDDIEEI